MKVGDTEMTAVLCCTWHNRGMKTCRAASLVLLVVVLSAALTRSSAQDQPSQPVAPATQERRFTIGSIDFFGDDSLNAKEIRTALPVREGEQSSTSELRLLRNEISDVVKHRTGHELTDFVNVCCDDDGSLVVYIGIAGHTGKPLTFNAEPTADKELPQKALELRNDMFEAMRAALLKGDSEEDDSLGYALAKNPDVRSKQLQVRNFAIANETLLRDVLRNSGNSQHRAAAAQFLGYANASEGQIQSLMAALWDKDSIVRNDAIRALAVMLRSNPGPAAQIPAEPFIELLNSGIWTDRNKGCAVLLELTRSRDPRLLRELNSKASTALIEMARWKMARHAVPARTILGRIAAIDESKLTEMVWQSDAVERIVRAAQEAD